MFKVLNVKQISCLGGGLELDTYPPFCHFTPKNISHYQLQRPKTSKNSNIFLYLLFFTFTGGKQIPPNYVQNIPLQRLGTRQDVADASLFLASGASSFITSNTLIVDGASWMTNPVSLATFKAISKL